MKNTDFQAKAFNNLQILVIGDAMIDRYFYGKINRQSPEANVPIVDVETIENRLGGAANVALNIAKMGAKAHLMTFKGNDDNAIVLNQLLNEAGVCNKLVNSERKTTVKTRIYNDNTYVMRYDIEERHDITDEELSALLKNIEMACQKVPLNAVVLQDYNKGLLTAKSIKAIIETVNNYNIPIAVDPKESNFLAYENVSLFKPNLKEVNKALNLNLEGTQQAELSDACTQLTKKLTCKNVLITLAQHGAVASNKNGFYSVSAHQRNVIDVSGAGDTVISMASLLLALNFPLEKILYYSNLAGGLVIEERGVKALSLEEWEKVVL